MTDRYLKFLRRMRDAEGKRVRDCETKLETAIEEGWHRDDILMFRLRAAAARASYSALSGAIAAHHELAPKTAQSWSAQYQARKERILPHPDNDAPAGGATTSGTTTGTPEE